MKVFNNLSLNNKTPMKDNNKAMNKDQPSSSHQQEIVS